MYEKLGATLATATILSGCYFAYDNYADYREQQPEQISTADYPDALPDAVAEQVENVVAITGMAKASFNIFQDYVEIATCSGVRVDEHDYLSAGHCVTFNQLPDNLTPYCYGIYVDVATDEKPATRLDSYKQAGFAPNKLSGEVGRLLDQKDILLVESVTEDPADQHDYDTPTVLRDSSETIRAGEDLYFINYEPTEDNRYRNPNNQAPIPPEMTDGDSAPVILGGIAIGYVNSDTIETITVDKSYGKSYDNGLREGASGGPVYDGSGRLVGTITASTLEPISLAEFEASRGVNITGLPEGSMVTPAYVKVITQQEIDDLQRQQTAFTQCVD